MPRRTRNFFLGVDQQLLDFGERVARDLASADVSASLTRVFALERAQHELAREASVYISVLAGAAPNEFSEWVGAQTVAARYRDLFTNAATDTELQAYQGVMGAPAAPAPLPTAFPTAGQTPAAYYAQYQQQSQRLDRAIDAVDSVVTRGGERRRLGGAARHPSLRWCGGVRHAAHAAAHLVRVARRGRSGAPPHRRRARDVAAPAPGTGRVAPHRR